MLNIEIVRGNADGSLVLEMNGNPSNGDGSAKRRWGVHWRVRPHINVEYIRDIKMKTGPGAPTSTNIFIGDPPAAQGGPHSTPLEGNCVSECSYWCRISLFNTLETH